jgi:hypothetical protein
MVAGFAPTAAEKIMTKVSLLASHEKRTPGAFSTARDSCAPYSFTKRGDQLPFSHELSQVVYLFLEKALGPAFIESEQTAYVAIT